MDFQEVVPDCVAYLPGFLERQEAESMFACLSSGVAWRQEHMTFGDRKVPLPRLVAWYGDPGARYFYSGIHNEPLPWLAGHMSDLRARCTALFPDNPFNSVLLNWYRDGNDGIGMHADNEHDLVDNSTIATVSLGATRTFRLKAKHGLGTAEVAVEGGSLLLMYGDCQKRWLHGIPKEPGTGARISLTFRTVRIK